MKTLLFFVTFIVLSVTASAEYRVFTLHISNQDQSQVKQVQTTLDPKQYIGFYPLSAGQKISYVETWRCFGRTDFFKPHCENPRLQPAAGANLDRKPASQSPEVLK